MDWLRSSYFFLFFLSFQFAWSENLWNDRSSKLPLQFEDIVPKNYDKLVPPTSGGKPTAVEIKISVLNINYVDEEKQVFGVDIFFHQIWIDPRLKFPATHNASSLLLDSKWRTQLWTPDTYFKKLVDGKVNDIIIPYSYMRLDRNATLFCATRISLKLDCGMDLGSYPHDVQECEILVMSLQHTTDDVVLIWREFQMTESILLAQYNVSGYWMENGIKSYPDIGNFSFISGKIHLSRRLGYFLINKYVPCVLIICMSFITFWIPAEAYPARVTLSVTSLLTIVTQQYQSATPSVSYVLALNIWMLSCIGFVFFSLLEYAFVIAVMNDRGTSLWPFRKMKKWFEPSKTALDSEVSTSPTHSMVETRKASHQIIDKISRLVFPLFFLVFCICYFVYFAVRSNFRGQK